MNIRFSSLALLLQLFLPALNAQYPLEYTAKQKTVLLLNSLSAPVWHSTAPHHQTDPLFALQPTLDALPGFPATATFFFSRTPHATSLQDFVDPTAFEETSLQPFIESGQKIEIQEHISGLHFGQLWSQDSLEIGWQLWIGARERNFWLKSDDRNEYFKTLHHYSSSPTRNASQDIHAPQEPQHRLTLWHATSTNVGLGDIHLQIRYRIPLHNRFSCAVGLYTTIPVGSLANRKTVNVNEDIPPLEGGHELAIRLINRARDIMLCTPLGNSGHLGLGGHFQAQLYVTQKLSIRGQFTQVYYKNSLENRFALSPATSLGAIEEGVPGSLDGISSNELIVQHLKQKLYPTEIKTEIRPGNTQCKGITLNYATIPFHGSLGYWHIMSGSEYSETAPLATLTQSTINNHQVHATAGWRRRQNWGEASSYLTGSYTVLGTQKGAWSIGIGATVQA